MAVPLALDRPRHEHRRTEKPRETKVEFEAREVRGGRSGNTQRAVGKDGAGFDGVRRMLAVAEKQAKTIEITSQIVPCLILWLSEVLLVFLWFTGGRRARNKGTLERRLEENFLHAQQVWTEQAPVIKPGCELECFTRDPAVFTPEGLIPESCPPLGRFQRSPGVADGKTGVPAGDEGWVQADWKPYIVAPKRKITIWCWICHLCNRSGMTMYTMECPQCSHQRCVNCSTYKQSSAAEKLDRAKSRGWVNPPNKSHGMAGY